MMFRSFRLGRFAPHHVIYVAGRMTDVFTCRTQDGLGVTEKFYEPAFPRAVLLDGKSCANANCFVEFFEK